MKISFSCVYTLHWVLFKSGDRQFLQFAYGKEIKGVIFSCVFQVTTFELIGLGLHVNT